MKRFAGIQHKTHFPIESEKFFKKLTDIFFSTLAIVLGIGLGCGWHFDTLTRFRNAFISQLLLTELAF